MATLSPDHMTAKERHHRAFLSVQQTQVTLRDLYMSVDG